MVQSLLGTLAPTRLIHICESNCLLWSPAHRATDKYATSSSPHRKLRWHGARWTYSRQGAKRRQGAKGKQIAMKSPVIAEDVVARNLVDAAYAIHTTLGPGLLESVYHLALRHELTERGFEVASEVAIPIRYKQLHIKMGFRADMIVNGIVIVELKSVPRVTEAHIKQTMTYARLANLRLGMLINFGAARIKDGITRLANGLPEPAPPKKDLGVLA